MDDSQFDGLVRAFGRGASRRGVLGLLAGLVLPLSTEARRKKSRSEDAKRGKGHAPQGKRNNRQHRKQRGNSAERQAQAEAVCYGGTSCTPKPGANLTGCDFTSSAAMKGATCAGCNLSKTGYRNADLSGADLSRTNLDKACLVGANLRGALLTGANSSGALYCGTIMPDGSVNNRDCAKGTACCPTCDAGRPCGSGQSCCANSCVAGNCCGNADCTDPAKPICRTNTCAACTTNAQCGTGSVCCDGQCKSGVCCTASTCADRTCQNKTCTGNQCVYTAVSNGAACGPNSTCQDGNCVCVPDCAGKTCGANDGCGGICQTCPNGLVCAEGICIAGPGTCPAGASSCDRTIGRGCNGNSLCQCQLSWEGTTACTSAVGGGDCGECRSTAQCAQLYPGAPGMICVKPSETGCCAPSVFGGGGFCVDPCPSSANA